MVGGAQLLNEGRFRAGGNPVENVNVGAVEPSMLNASVIEGSEVFPTRIVPATSKSITSAPGAAFDSTIA